MEVNTTSAPKVHLALLWQQLLSRKHSANIQLFMCNLRHEAQFMTTSGEGVICRLMVTVCNVTCDI